MGNNLLIPNVASDAVAVFDGNFNQLFMDARPIRARVGEDSTLFDHTIESGEIITDYSIILPIEIELSLIVEAESYRDMYQEIRDVYTNKTLVTVVTRTATYPDMVLGSMPHDEKPDMYDALPITLHFRQAQLVDLVPNFQPANPAQANTQTLGTQTSYPITPVMQTMTQGEAELASQNFYSSVQAASNPQGVTINGVQTPNGLANMQLAPAVSQIPVTGVQTLTSQQTVIRGFN